MSEITIRSNWIESNRKNFTAKNVSGREGIEVSPEHLTDILIDSRKIVLDGIESYYNKMVRSHPEQDIVRPSIFTVYLGPERMEKQILSEQGLANGGVIEAREEFEQASQNYFDAIKQAGFRPEARRMSGARDGGLWMLLRRPTPLQVSTDWLGDSYVLPTFEPALELSKRRSIVARFQDERMENAERLDDQLKDTKTTQQEKQLTRSRLHISTILGSAVLKKLFEFGEPEEDIEDAFEYAWNTPGISSDILLAIENIESL